MTAYLTLDDALRVVERFGFHIRDHGLLQSALARPATTVMGQDAYVGLSLKAAVLLESAARNHALVDGNKRTSWTLMVLFLWINGCRHDFGTQQAFDLVTGIAAGTVDAEYAARLIGDHTISRNVPEPPAVPSGTLPELPVLRQLRSRGWRLKDISRHYGVGEADVWRAISAK